MLILLLFFKVDFFKMNSARQFYLICQINFLKHNFIIQMRVS